MAPPKYKLVYFNVRGRAEISRLLFAQAGVEYEDSRLTGEQFAALKGDVKRCPLGQLPILVIDGDKVLPQSHAIERHLARTFGLNGKSERDTTLIDVVCETVIDLSAPVMKFHYEKDETKKAELIKEFLEKGSVPIFTALSRALQNNNEGKGFFVGDSMTLADCTVFVVTEGLCKAFPVLFEKYPILKEFDDRMRAQPNIAAWLAKRPDTPM